MTIEVPPFEFVTGRPAKDRADQDSLDDACRKVMGSKWGRHFVWSCIAGQDVLRTVSSTNSLTMSASAGVNDYVVNVLRRLRDLSPSEFIKMQEEAHERDRNAAARSAPNTNHG